MTIGTYNNILSFLRQKIAGTPWEGHVYAVGGCCRDEIMGHPINDVDLAIDTPDGGIAFARWLHEGKMTVGTPVEFARYGTAMLRLRRFAQHEIELVQTRCGKYVRAGDGSDNVCAVFGTVNDDAMRRDLTINTLFKNVSTGQMHDFTGKALDDIASHCLRTPMPPRKTFEDDPVRMLRVIRMASRLGWRIDSRTLDAIKENAAWLKQIKPERLCAETEKMLTCPDPVRAMTLLRDTGLYRYTIPALEKSFGLQIGLDSRDTLWARAMAMLRHLQTAKTEGDDVVTRWAVLLYGLGLDPGGDTPHPGYLSNDEKTVAANDRAAAQALAALHHHSKFILSVKYLLRNAGYLRKFGPALEKAKDRQLVAFRRGASTAQRFQRMLTFAQALNRTDTVHPEYMDQTDALIARLEAIDAKKGVSATSPGPTPKRHCHRHKKRATKDKAKQP